MGKAVGELEWWHVMLLVFEISASLALASTDIVRLLSSSQVSSGLLSTSYYTVIAMFKAELKIVE